ncbi:uncharacterized protein Bfra_004599 [Botrytis fragariae]|uniref:Uncharacterized protein n=1 Tax=Botrytis fragariae TaxID=1964551 RepID=A0A8H6AW16_9HELO|nr:uncharacterized protein Bfra_004599 [Botrytis fragariae]KAF5874588.1 hypothetical protein Bfra_004599 [Botrytis fragariae]
MLKACNILTPDNLPEGVEKFNFVYRKLCKLDKIVRKLKQKPSSDRAIIIKHLKDNVISELKTNIHAARADISEKEKKQKVVKSVKMNMSDIPSVDLSFEALMSEVGSQVGYTHTKYTSRIMDLLQLIRNLKDVPNSSYHQNRASCQNKVKELRQEIFSHEKLLNHEKENLEEEIRLGSKKDWEIKSGQIGVPLNGRDHQYIKNFLEGALQKKSEEFEGLGMIKVWSLITDREYLDMLIERLEPGHGMFTFRINPVINECYRGVAGD